MSIDNRNEDTTNANQASCETQQMSAQHDNGQSPDAQSSIAQPESAPKYDAQPTNTPVSAAHAPNVPALDAQPPLQNNAPAAKANASYSNESNPAPMPPTNQQGPIPPAGFTRENRGVQPNPQQNGTPYPTENAADGNTQSIYQNTQNSPEGQNQPQQMPNLPPIGQQVKLEDLNLDEETLDQLVRARKLAMLACLASAISFFIGGILLCSAALAAGILSYTRYSAVSSKIKNNDEMQRTYKRMGIVAVAVPAVTLAINVFTFIMIYPLVMEAVQTGSLDQLFSAGGGTTGTSGGGTTSTWG